MYSLGSIMAANAVTHHYMTDDCELYAYWDIYVKRTVNILTLTTDTQIRTVFEYHGNIVVVTQRCCVIVSPTTNKIKWYAPDVTIDLLPMGLDMFMDVHSVRGIENIVFWIDRTRTQLHIAPSSNSIYLLVAPVDREYDILYRWFLLKYGVCMLDDLLMILSCALVTVYRCDMSEVDCPRDATPYLGNSIMALSRDQYVHATRRPAARPSEELMFSGSSDDSDIDTST